MKKYKTDMVTEENDSTLSTVNRKFDINWEKLKTVDDVKSLLKGLQINVYLYRETIPDHLKECFEKDFFTEVKYIK